MITINTEEFKKKYKGLDSFVGSYFWDRICASVGDEVLWSHILFCVDYLEVPPIVPLMKARWTGGLTPSNRLETRGMGCLISYIMSKYGYKPDKYKWVGGEGIGMKNAMTYTCKGV